MNPADCQTLNDLLQRTRVAALATLHGGDPALSMVPFALLPEAGALVLHVSQLATHTQDMQRHAQVALLLVAEAGPTAAALQLPRLSLRGPARRCTPDDAHYAAARAAYLAKLPEAEPLFGFGDFSLFLLEPRSARFVAGFGSAHSLVGARLQQALRGRLPAEGAAAAEAELVPKEGTP